VLDGVERLSSQLHTPSEFIAKGGACGTHWGRPGGPCEKSGCLQDKNLPVSCARNCTPVPSLASPQHSLGVATNQLAHITGVAHADCLYKKYSGCLHAHEADSAQCFTGFSQERRLMIN
jgi:hypothetical protein